MSVVEPAPKAAPAVLRARVPPRPGVAMPMEVPLNKMLALTPPVLEEVLSLHREFVYANVVVTPENLMPEEEAVLLGVLRRVVARVRDAAKNMDLTNPIPESPVVAESVESSPPVLPPPAVTEAVDNEDDNDSWGQPPSAGLADRLSDIDA